MMPAAKLRAFSFATIFVMLVETFYVLLVSAVPVIELRGAIPLAVLVYDFLPLTALLISVLGNLIPPILVIPLLGRAHYFFSARSAWWRKTFDYFLDRTRRDHGKKFEVFADLALIILVAIPLPLTGAWTASLAVYIFGIPLRRALPLIFVGLLIAGLLTLVATLGLEKIF